MKQWSIKDEIKEQLKLFWFTFLEQILPGFRLTAIQKHIIAERRKVTRAFWLKIMHRDNWYCYLCRQKIPYGQAELEHKLALVNWGYTTETNCFASHSSCNRAKGRKLI